MTKNSVGFIWSHMIIEQPAIIYMIYLLLWIYYFTFPIIYDMVMEWICVVQRSELTQLYGP